MKLSTGHLNETSNRLITVFIIDGNIVPFKVWLMCVLAEMFKECPELKKYYEK